MDEYDYLHCFITLYSLSSALFNNSIGDVNMLVNIFSTAIANNEPPKGLWNLNIKLTNTNDDHTHR